MLLVTDRLEHANILSTALCDQGKLTLISIDDQEVIFNEEHRIMIGDVDLENSTNFDRIGKLCVKASEQGIPVVFLVRNRSSRAQIAADQLGASAILSANASDHVLRSTVRQLIEEIEQQHGAGGDRRHIRAHISLATAALEELIANARNGGSISTGTTQAGVEAISGAVNRASVSSWLDLVWEHDDLTFQHSLLVTGLASAFCRKLQFSEVDRNVITCAALLHDIGKAKVPLELLNKPGRLSSEEQSIMRQHPEWGYSMLRGQGGFPDLVMEVALSHHEYLDGSGYPRRLRGNEIIDPVRIVTICDVFAALIERRSYKNPMNPAIAHKIMIELKDRFDVRLLNSFYKIFARLDS